MAKFAVISHIFPPSPSGQSILLERLLRQAEPDSYCLIHSGQANDSPGALPGKHHRLKAAKRIPVINISLIFGLTLVLNTIWGILDRARQIAEIVRRENCDLLIGCTGDLYDLPATWLAGRWTGRPFIAYIMDDYIFQWTGSQRRMAAWLEPKFVRQASKVFVLNEFVRNSYDKRYGIHSDVIHNPVRLPDLDRLDHSATGSASRTIRIVYTGAVYRAHFDAFKNLVDVLNHHDRHPIQLHIYTSQPKGLLEQQGIAGPAIVFHHYIDQQSVFKVLRQADVLFLPLAFHSPIPEVIQTSAPFKTSEYLAAGRPILVHAPAGSFLSWYFREHNCGFIVDQDDRQLLEKSLDDLLRDTALCQTLSRNARRQAEIDFNIDVIRPVFFGLLNQVRAG